MYENMLQNALNCTIQKNFRGCMSHKPPSKCVAMPRVASRFAACNYFFGLDYNSPAPQKSCPPPLGKSCIRSWTTIKKIFEEMSS